MNNLARIPSFPFPAAPMPAPARAKILRFPIRVKAPVPFHCAADKAAANAHDAAIARHVCGMP